MGGCCSTRMNVHDDVSNWDINLYEHASTKYARWGFVRMLWLWVCAINIVIKSMRSWGGVSIHEMYKRGDLAVPPWNIGASYNCASFTLLQHFLFICALSHETQYCKMQPHNRDTTHAKMMTVTLKSCNGWWCWSTLPLNPTQGHRRSALVHQPLTWSQNSSST